MPGKLTNDPDHVLLGAAMLLIDRREVDRLLDLGELVDAVAVAMADLSAGRASVPPRVGAQVAAQGAVLAAMPGYSPALGVLAAKLLAVFPRNTPADGPTHRALIAVFDPATGAPVALMDGDAITAARTAACSALSIRLLARADARVLTVLGTGVQAHAHALAATAVRPFAEVRIAGRSREKAEQLADGLRASGLPATATTTWPEALAGADVVCATTSTQEPLVRREWLAPGVHVASVGYTAGGREVDDATVADALVVVESRDTASAPYPVGTDDIAVPLARGVLDRRDLVEIGELVDGRRPGRTSAEQITLYKSVGVAVQDAAAAGLVVACARRAGAGREIEL
jgi:alanine dehydrogenase